MESNRNRSHNECLRLGPGMHYLRIAHPNDGEPAKSELRVMFDVDIALRPSVVGAVNLHDKARPNEKVDSPTHKPGLSHER